VSFVSKFFLRIEFEAQLPVAGTMPMTIEDNSQTRPLLMKLGPLQFLQSVTRLAAMELQLTQLEPLRRYHVVEQTHLPVKYSKLYPV
jgi:hypothetical protein